MFLPLSSRKWLRLPSRIALLLGLGALTVAAAKPATAQPDLDKGPVRAPQQSAKSFGEVRIWSDGGRIFFSEGDEPQELRLGDTTEARRLRELLEQDGATVNSPRLLPHRLILVGGGGEAIHWGRAQPPKARSNAGNSAIGSNPNLPANPPTKPPEQAGNADHTNMAGADRLK